MQGNLDSLVINLNKERLWVLNITLALIMFGVALGISMEDFKRLFKFSKLLLAGIISQFFLLPLVTFIFIKLVNPMSSIALGMMLLVAFWATWNIFSGIVLASYWVKQKVKE